MSSRRTGRRLHPLAAVTVLPLLLAGCTQGGNESVVTLTETPSAGAASPSTSPAPTLSRSATPDPGATRTASDEPTLVRTVATGLEVPWGLDFLPGGDAVVTERDSTRVLRVSPQGQVRVLGRLDIAQPVGEAGALGVAVSPDFAEDRTLFFYVTTERDNRVVRTTLEGNRIGELEAILTDIPRGQIHDGGRVEFGPDGHLYVSTGEIGERELAQDRDSLAGKILRITTDGDPAPGNPFDSPVWSYGHRNVQGLAFADGQLYASEFGQNAFDELNRITAGENYGWPLVEGEGGTDQGFTDPQQVWGTDVASPSGLAWTAGHLWMASLRGERLWRLAADADAATEPTAFFIGDHGRMRTVVTAPDGRLWVTTSNRDGRGSPRDGDDKILLIRP